MNRRKPLKIRKVDDSTARSEILGVFDRARKSKYPDEIADKLRLPVTQVVKICDDLTSENKIGTPLQLISILETLISRPRFGARS